MVLLADRYELGRKIGEGGAAVVYEGRDRRLDRPVAIKVPRAQIAADDRAVARFRREARAAANLTHPNVVQVYDFGQGDLVEQEGDTSEPFGTDGGLVIDRESGSAGRPAIHFMVMEYLSGPTLREYLDVWTERAARRRTRPGLPPAEAVAIIRQVLAGLEAAHQRGLVHRDVKPANVLFASEPEGASPTVKVTDFGIARALDSPDLTSAGETVGTAYYISPEQARGEPVGPASDVYSTGVVLFEMLAGRRPFDGATSYEIAVKHIEQPAPALRSIAPDVPPGLERIVARALAKDLATRWPSAAAFDRALADFSSEASQATTTMASVTPPPAGKLDPGRSVAPGARQFASSGEQPGAAEAANDVTETARLVRRPPTAERLARRPTAEYPPPAEAPVRQRPRSSDYQRRQAGRPLFVSMLLFFIAGFFLVFCAGTGLVAVDRSAASKILGALGDRPTIATGATPVSQAVIAPTATLAPRPTNTPAAPAPTPRPAAPPTVAATATPSAPPRPSGLMTIGAGAFAGACRLPGAIQPPGAREVFALFGGKSKCSEATAAFELASRPAADATLTLAGLGSPGDPVGLEIVVNNQTIFAGRSPLGVESVLTEAALRVPEGVLRAGQNTLTIRNTVKNGKENAPPFIVLAGAVVSYR